MVSPPMNGLVAPLLQNGIVGGMGGGLGGGTSRARRARACACAAAAGGCGCGDMTIRGDVRGMGGPYLLTDIRAPFDAFEEPEGSGRCLAR